MAETAFASGEQLNNLSLNDGDDDFVDPWTVSSKSETGIDYDKLISECFITDLKFNMNLGKGFKKLGQNVFYL